MVFVRMVGDMTYVVLHMEGNVCLEIVQLLIVLRLTKELKM